MATLYPDITDTMNKTAFQVVMNEDYLFKVPEYYKQFPHLAPIFIGDNQTATAMITISNMIELISQQQYFTLERDEDVSVVADILETYTTMLAELIRQMPSFPPSIELDSRKSYLAKCTTALAHFKHRQEIVVRSRDITNGHAKREESSIFNILKALGGK